jgi:hypothetical protein
MLPNTIQFLEMESEMGIGLCQHQLNKRASEVQKVARKAFLKCVHQFGSHLCFCYLLRIMTGFILRIFELKNFRECVK